MSAWVRNMTFQEGEIVQLKVRKRVGERFVERDARVAAAANWQGCTYFATMRDGKWNIWSTAYVREHGDDSAEAAWERARHEPIIRDVSVAAAEMWLRHRSGA